MSSPIFLIFAFRENPFKSLPCKGELEKSVECQAQTHKEDLAYWYKFRIYLKEIWLNDFYQLVIFLVFEDPYIINKTPTENAPPKAEKRDGSMCESGASFRSVHHN